MRHGRRRETEDSAPPQQSELQITGQIELRVTSGEEAKGRGSGRGGGFMFVLYVVESAALT